MVNRTAEELRITREAAVGQVSEFYAQRATSEDDGFTRVVEKCKLYDRHDLFEKLMYDTLAEGKLVRALYAAVHLGPQAEDQRAVIAISAYLRGDQELADIALSTVTHDEGLHSATQRILENLAKIDSRD